MSPEYEAACEIRGAINSLEDELVRVRGELEMANRLKRIELEMAFGAEAFDAAVKRWTDEEVARG